MNEPLDTIRLNETPEGIDLGLRVAGPAVRSLAWVLDTVIRLGLYLVLTPLLTISGFGTGLILIGVFLLEWFYPVAFELWSGATPGKRAMGLLVVHDDGTPVGAPASLIRNLLRVVDFLPIFYGVGLVSTLLDRDFRRLGDLAAGTLVIHADPRDAKRPMSEADPLALPQGLPLSTQQAILSFAERAHRLSGARREELAQILLQSLDGKGVPAGPVAMDRILGHAAWLARGS